jgi:hypothetical protein
MHPLDFNDDWLATVLDGFQGLRLTMTREAYNLSIISRPSHPCTNASSRSWTARRTLPRVSILVLTNCPKTERDMSLIPIN